MCIISVLQLKISKKIYVCEIMPHTFSDYLKNR